MAKLLTKHCVTCKEPFTCTNPKQRYCYNPCIRPMSDRENLVPQLWGDSCCVCGARAKSLSHRSFCSIACRKEHRRRVMPVNICLRCGNPYSLRKMPRNGFCSNSCKKEYESLTPKDWEALDTMRSQLRREMYQSQVSDLRAFMNSLFGTVDAIGSTLATVKERKSSVNR